MMPDEPDSASESNVPVVPVVAVVGRPNVGKSTLVNRILGSRQAVVEDVPGVTRDRVTYDALWNGRAFTLVDTGGWEPSVEGSESLAARVAAQARVAVDAADAVLFVVDATVGVTDADAAVASVLRRSGKPIVVAANKVDDTRAESEAAALWSLGLGEPAPVSALHGRGSGDLLDAVVAALPAPAATEVQPEADGGPFSIAIVGRPNVGKSTLFNRLVGDERAVVHDEPGTTRDSIDTVIETEDGPLRFVDTAGMRRRSRVDEPTEYYSLVRALESVDRADAALFVIDATEGVTHQDQRLAERVDAAGTAAIVVLNKWDLTDADRRRDVLEQAADRLSFLGYAPVVKVSALTGRNLRHVLPALREAEQAYHRRVPTAALNRVVTDAQQRQPPPVVRKRRPRVLYATQGASDPPTFTFFATHELPATYLRYLEHRIRDAFDLGPTPVKIRVRLRGR